MSTAVAHEPSRALLTRSACELAAMIRAGDATSREVVEAHIAHIQEVNPSLNALVHDRFSLALQEADEADEAIAQGVDVGPMHGVPCSIKECFALTGMPQSAGLVSRRDIRARQDATTVARLRAAGAIPLGVTNVPELCMWYETHNKIYGRTSNAYSPHHISGGSSGGEGALIGAGGSPFGLGSDVGGSIRMPALFNGIFGHKPTGGLVPATGQYPAPKGIGLTYLSTGPMCRRAEDLMPLLEILRGPDGQDSRCQDFDLGDPTQVDLSDLTVYLQGDNGVVPVHQEIQDAMHRAGGMLERLGADVRETFIEGFRHGLEIWGAMLGQDPGPSFAELLFEGGRASLARELARWGRQRSEHTLPALILAGLEPLSALAKGRSREMIARGEKLRDDLIRMLGSNGVLLHPTFPTAAPRHLVPITRPFHFQYAAIFNVLGVPSTQVPLGLNRDRLPVGLQVIAAPGQDHLTIAVAMALEDAFGGWVPPWQAL